MTTPTVHQPPVHKPALSMDMVPDENTVHELTASLLPRFAPATPAAELERMVRTALEELAPVRVTTYLELLVERRVSELAQVTPRHG